MVQGHWATTPSSSPSCASLGALSPPAPPPPPPSSSSWSPELHLSGSAPETSGRSKAAQAVPSASNALPASASAAKSPLLVGLLGRRGFQGPLPQPHWCLRVCPQDTRALGPGIPSPQALAPWPQRRERGNRRMGDATRAEEGPGESCTQGRVSRAGRSTVVRVGRGPLPPPGQGALRPAWPPHAWPCWVLGGALPRSPPVWAGNPKVYTCRSADTGNPPLRVPAPKTEHVPPAEVSTLNWMRGHTPGVLRQGAAGKRGCHAGRAGGSWAEPGHPEGP